MALLVQCLAVGIRSGDAPVASGLVYAYDTGTTTPGTYLYTEPTLTTAHSNPATLNADGKLEAYCSDTANFRIRIRNAADTSTIDEFDPATSSNGTSTANITVGTALANAFTDGAAETLSDAIGFLWTGLSGQSAAATAKDLRYLHTGTGAVGRYWRAHISDRYNIRDFGASTSETAANNRTYIQAAIDACATGGGGGVYIPGGAYLTSGTLNINNQDNVCIYGDGPGSIIRASGFSNAAVFTVAGTSDGIEFAGFQIQGAGTSLTTGALGISVASTVGDTLGEIPVNVHDMVFSGPSDGTGLNVGVECLGQRGSVTNCYFQRHYGTNSCGVRLNTGSLWRVVGNHMILNDGATACQYGIANPGGTGGGGHVITSNYIEDASVAGIYVSTLNGVNITGNRVQGTSGGHGINVVGSFNFSVFGNTVSGCSGSGIAIGTDCYGFTVSGNSSQSNTTHGIYVAQSADSAATVPRNGMILGNDCRTNVQNGINLTGTDKIAVVGNIVTDNGSNGTYAGIEITTALPVATHRGGNNNSVIGNFVTDTSGTVHSVPIRIRRSGGGETAFSDAGMSALRTTAIMFNRFQQNAGTTLYTFGIANTAPPIFVGNVATGLVKGRTSVTADTTLLAEQSGSIIDNAGATGAVNLTLPDILDNQYNQGLEFQIVRQAGFNFVVIAGSGDTIYETDGTSGSITLNGTKQHVRIWSVGIEWRAEVV